MTFFDISYKLIPQIFILDITSLLGYKFDEGYTRNNYIGPFNDALELEGDQYFEENVVLDHVSHLLKNKSEPVQDQVLDQEAPQNIPELTPPLKGNIPIEDDVFKELKNPKLLHELKIRGINCAVNMENGTESAARVISGK